MFVLHRPQKLQILYESLKKYTPESLKVKEEWVIWGERVEVYGAIYHITNKNPFNLEVLVDAWPAYQTVLVRPQKEEMKDDLDHYTNTYHIFTKAPDKLEEILACPEVINWEQAFQVQGCQESVDQAIRKIAASKSVLVRYEKTKLFTMETPKTPNAWRDHKVDLTALTNEPQKDENEKQGHPVHILDASHARLINEQWNFGKNERGLKYVERCLRNFPGFGVLGPEGLPISWLVMEQSCELRMAYTVPEYRSQGNMWRIGAHLVEYLAQRKIPFYVHVADERERTQQIVKLFGFNEVSCDWHQWQCTPREYC